MKKVFITGGAGFIGSHCAISLIENGFIPIIIDNFSNSDLNIIEKLKLITKKKILFYKEDLRNKKKIISIFKKHQCHAVIHCAGYKAVGESVKKPISYYENNIASTLSLLECMKEFNVYKLIFSSSATVYDNTQPLPWKETYKTGKTTSPYGASKYIIEQILMDLINYDKRWSIRIARYFNPIGNHSSGLIKENPKGTPNNLLPYVIKVAQKKLPYVKIFGNNYKTKDGTGVRDYIHVMDLAEGHIAMLKENIMSKGLQIYNLGAGRGVSVLEIIKTFEKKTGVPIPYKFSKRRDGDIAEFFCSSKKALKDLKWKAKRNIDQAMIDIKKTL